MSLINKDGTDLGTVSKEKHVQKNTQILQQLTQNLIYQNFKIRTVNLPHWVLLCSLSDMLKCIQSEIIPRSWI